MRRNTIVLGALLFILATFAWAGWANFEFRKQAADRLMAQMAKGELVADAAGDDAKYVSPLTGKVAPAFELEDLSGKKVSLASYKGKAVLVNFWATWCAPCKIETPWLIELRNQYAAQGFEILGLSADDIDRDDAQKLADEKKEIAHSAERLHIPYPVLIDGGTLDKDYGGLDVLPMSFYVDRDGTVVAVQMGLTSKGDMEANVKKALGN
ncbi:MAG TPA: TlpA disulfide reductase family protein [Terracidiphilus sp.]|nr:TlpA disulfide reductase family protein [Terracidiphilus sp.]